MPTPNYYTRHKGKLANETNRLLEQKFALLRTLQTTECTLLAVLVAFLPGESLPKDTRIVYFVGLALLLFSILTSLLSLYGRIVLGERFLEDYYNKLETARETESRVGDIDGYIPKFSRVCAIVSVISFFLSLCSILLYAYLAMIVDN